MDKALYVVSEDLQLLLDRWSEQRFGTTFQLPYGPIRTRLKGALTFNGHEVLQVPASDLQVGVRQLLNGERRPIISVDPVYYPTEHMLQVTRCVDEQLQTLPGLHGRFGFRGLEDQVSEIAYRLGASKDRLIEAVLVDDVVYSGEVIKQIMAEFQTHNVQVRLVVAGIAVVGGEDNSDPFQACAVVDCTLKSVHVFSDIVDEICERDFFVFSPMCGMSFNGSDRNAGVPYIFPFGNPVRWASFTEAEQIRISQQIIELNIEVLKAIEDQIHQPIIFSDLDRVPVGVRHSNIKSERVLLHLQAHVI